MADYQGYHIEVIVRPVQDDLISNEETSMSIMTQGEPFYKESAIDFMNEIREFIEESFPDQERPLHSFWLEPPVQDFVKYQMHQNQEKNNI